MCFLAASIAAANSYPTAAIQTQSLQLADTNPCYAPPPHPPPSIPAAAYNPHQAPKPASWGPPLPADPTAATTIYAPPPFPDPYQMYGSPVAPAGPPPAGPHQEIYAPPPLHPNPPTHGF